jgi:hypothetical protein
MRDTNRRDSGGENRVLCAVALVCYLTALAALCGAGYSLTTLVLAAAGREVTTTYSRPGF